MYEFDSVSVSSYEAPSLAAKLTEKSADGWDVVGIVTAGSDVTAYLRKTSGAADAASGGDEAAIPEAVGVGASDAPSEPVGWGTAPAEAPAASWGTGTTDTSGASWGTTSSGDTSGWGSSSTAASAAPTATPSTPAVPPGWYADPAGRYDLRYWDGSAWTEHVSRAGQQYTDPPVA